MFNNGTHSHFRLFYVIFYKLFEIQQKIDNYITNSGYVVQPLTEWNMLSKICFVCVP